jgi:hypothetical protein
MIKSAELKTKREQQQNFEEDFFSKAKVVQIEIERGVFLYTVQSSYRSKLGKLENVHAQITPANRIKHIPHKIRNKLLTAYQDEFVREGSYMEHPDEGYVITFSIDSKPTGFFYLDENEFVENNSIPSLSKHLEEGTIPFEALPEELKNILYSYLLQFPGPVDMRTVGEEVARPMRFYVYPEAQGNGSLKVLLSLVTLSTALLNEDKKEIYQLVEARAGLVGNNSGSISAVNDHQLVPPYLAKGYDPSRLNGSGIISWDNPPYRNMSITKPVDVEQVLYLARNHSSDKKF